MVGSDLPVGTCHWMGSAEIYVHHGGVEALTRAEVCVSFPQGR